MSSQTTPFVSLKLDITAENEERFPISAIAHHEKLADPREWTFLVTYYHFYFTSHFSDPIDVRFTSVTLL